MDKDVEASIVPIIQAMGGSRDNIVEIIEQDGSSTAPDKECQSLSIENSTNHNKSNKDSLTHSQISMLSKDNDHGSHLYSTPESIKNDEKTRPIASKENIPDDRSQISKKSVNKFPIMPPPPPPPPLPQKENVKKEHTFPTMIILGALQLVLSIILAALGGLVIARNAHLSMAFSGIWAGAIAGVTGSLAIINVKSAQTGFLAASLISVASGTLASSLTGIGLLRDWNIVHQDEVSVLLKKFRHLNSKVS